MKRLALLLPLAVALSPATAHASRGQDKVAICHATSSESNPYVLIEVAASAVDGEGKNDHTSHEDDIIPAPEADGEPFCDFAPPPSPDTSGHTCTVTDENGTFDIIVPLSTPCPEEETSSTTSVTTEPTTTATTSPSSPGESTSTGDPSSDSGASSSTTPLSTTLLPPQTLTRTADPVSMTELPRTGAGSVLLWIGLAFLLSGGASLLIAALISFGMNSQSGQSGEVRR